MIYNLIVCENVSGRKLSVIENTKSECFYWHRLLIILASTISYVIYPTFTGTQAVYVTLRLCFITASYNFAQDNLP